ncbi:MAG: hypothetical protein PHX54_10825, partial [Lentimicrobiaceae bacterium]|nr:hypothetical protein [Lentimicrobiaceae bacterium]
TELDVPKTDFTRFTREKYAQLYKRPITAEALAGANAVTVFAEAMKTVDSVDASEVEKILARVGKETTGNPSVGRQNEIVIGVSVRGN